MRKKQPIVIPMQPTTSILRRDTPFELTLNTTIEPTAFQQYQFISQAALKLGTHIVGGVGSGKSRLLGRIFAWMVLLSKRPGVILDPTGGVVDNLFDKIFRLPPSDQTALWQRIIYITPGNKEALFPTHLSYHVRTDDTLAEIANRFPSVLKRQDPHLQEAPILGWNSLYECLLYAGQIAAAKGLQLDFMADLIDHPGHYKGVLREALAQYPHLQPAVTYFRALMDPSAGSLRERKTGSAKTKLLPFLADPIRMATYAAKENLLDWPYLLAQRKLILIDYRYQLDADNLQFDMLWHFRSFIDAIKHRGMAGRGQEIMLILDEITAMLGQHTPNGHSLLAEDLQELISRLGRAYGVNTVIAHQGIFQVEERIQNLFMGMGNQLIGQLANPDDAIRVARQFMRYDPYKLKKTEAVYGTIHPPAILSYFGGPSYPYPQVIDERTIEFTPEEQLLAWVNKILDLDRFQFFAQLATGEGGKRGSIKKITIENLDKDQYPNETILIPLREALAKRDGIPAKKLLAEIQANRIEVIPEKKQNSPRQTSKEPVTMEGSHDPCSPQSPQSVSNPGNEHNSAAGTAGSDTNDFWQPITAPQEHPTHPAG